MAYGEFKFLSVFLIQKQKDVELLNSSNSFELIASWLSWEY